MVIKKNLAAPGMGGTAWSYIVCVCVRLVFIYIIQCIHYAFKCTTYYFNLTVNGIVFDIDGLRVQTIVA